MELHLFPEKLLNSPLEDRHEYFKSYTVSHPAFEEAYDDLVDRIYFGSKNAIILVFGPTGAVFVNIVVVFYYFSILIESLKSQVQIRLPRCAWWSGVLNRKEKRSFDLKHQKMGILWFS